MQGPRFDSVAALRSCHRPVKLNKNALLLPLMLSPISIPCCYHLYPQVLPQAHAFSFMFSSYFLLLSLIYWFAVCVLYEFLVKLLSVMDKEYLLVIECIIVVNSLCAASFDEHICFSSSPSRCSRIVHCYLAIQRSVWRDIKFAFCFVCFLFVRLRISQRRMVRSAWNFGSG